MSLVLSTITLLLILSEVNKQKGPLSAERWWYKCIYNVITNTWLMGMINMWSAVTWRNNLYGHIIMIITVFDLAPYYCSPSREVACDITFFYPTWDKYSNHQCGSAQSWATWWIKVITYSKQMWIWIQAFMWNKTPLILILHKIDQSLTTKGHIHIYSF